jgi:hypothetical protein
MRLRVLTGLRAQEKRRVGSGKVGRPSLSWHWAPSVREILRAEPHLKTAEVYRRVLLQGYPGGKSAFYQLVALCRVAPQGSE